MRRTRRANAGVTVVELVVIIVCICVAVLILVPLLRPTRSRSAVHWRCSSKLKQIGIAMDLYLTTLGGNSYFAEPAAAFRGDEFVVNLFWTGIDKRPRLFACTATSDTGPVDADGDPVPIPTTWNRAGNLTDIQCSYAGRCKGLTGKYAYRNTPHPFTKALIGSTSPVACDKAGNHGDGVNVLYGDGHVEFIPDAGDKVGTDNSALDDSDPMKGLQYNG